MLGSHIHLPTICATGHFPILVFNCGKNDVDIWVQGIIYKAER